MTTTFARVLDSLCPTSDREFIVRVPDDWLQGRTVFGGMQVALAARAMRSVMTGAQDLPLRSLQATFVGPLLGDQQVRVRAEQLRAGRTATHARCDLLLDGQVAFTAVAIFGPARPSLVSLEMPRPVVAADPEALRDWRDIPGLTPAFQRHFQMRTAVGKAPFRGYPDPHSTIFAKLRDRDCTPEDALIALSDVIPSPALSTLNTRAVVSSLNWTLELLGDPAKLARDDWALIDTRVRAGGEGFLSQTSILWGPAGHAFSVSHQTVGIFG